MATIHAGDVGITYCVPSNVSLQNATSVNMRMILPNGSHEVIPGAVGTTILNDANNNPVAAAYFWAYFVTTGKEFPAPGTYEVQLQQVVISGGVTTLDTVCDAFTETILPRN